MRFRISISGHNLQTIGLFGKNDFQYPKILVYSIIYSDIILYTKKKLFPHFRNLALIYGLFYLPKSWPVWQIFNGDLMISKDLLDKKAGALILELILFFKDLNGAQRLQVDPFN